MSSECETSTSVGTIRGLHRLNTMVPVDHARTESPLPSPSSPSGDSVSSLPSVSSSFLLSSGPASPPHTPADSDHEDIQGLVIPSLTLPSPGQRATPWGKMLGDLRLLFLAPRFASMDARTLVSVLLEGNDDVVDSGDWEHDEEEGHTVGRRSAVLHASTHWIEHRDAHGLEHTEPAHNVEFMELAPYDPGDDAETVVSQILAKVHGPFKQVHDTLHPQCAPSNVLAGLLASASTPLYTALVLLLTTSPSPAEKTLITALSAHVPLIVFPPFAPPPTYPTSSYPYSNTYLEPPRNALPAAAALSAFRPHTPNALRIGLFRSPDTLALLRSEAAARFLRWREVERAVYGVPSPLRRNDEGNRTVRGGHGGSRFNKAEWEAQWEGTLSQEVAVRRRERAGTALRTSHSDAPRASSVCPKPERRAEGGADGQRCVDAFDPLNIPSLVVFSLSLLGPLRTRMVGVLKSGFGWSPLESGQSGRAEVSRGFSFGLGLALVGAFCAGIGIGFLVTRV